MKKFLHLTCLCTALLIFPVQSNAEPVHALAFYGDPALRKGFESLPYADPDAPQGGRITYGERGRFDSLNPYTVKGRAPWAIRTHVFESLMARSWDEPFTVYGLLAESVEVAPDRKSVTFTLNPSARFSNGEPVTPDDIIFSMEILRDEGRPNFATYYNRVAAVEMTGENAVTFTFKEAERELPLLLGLMPIHARSDWEDRDFAETTLRAPMTSGPYSVETVEVGERLTLRKRDDYWGKNLPINRGIHNFDEVTYLYFRDNNSLWEAFKAGLVDQRRETNPTRWLDEYDFPAVTEGKIIRDEMSHGRATGMEGLVFNTRNPLFADRAVREALLQAFDFEWINTTLNRGAYERIQSYFSNSRLGASGPAEGIEHDLLLPYADALPEGAMEGDFALPVTDGTGRDRTPLRQAAKLLREAGWRIVNGALVNGDDQPFAFEILLRNSGDDEKIASIFAKTLERLGIDVSLRIVEGAQYQTRLTSYDFDMIFRRWWLSLSPGGEQEFYFGSDGVTKEGTRNYMGADNPAIDAMIEAMLDAENDESYVAAIRALDRVLTAERYVIPLWYEPVERMAWYKPLGKPERTALYGYRPEVWWSAEGVTGGE